MCRDTAIEAGRAQNPTCTSRKCHLTILVPCPDRASPWPTSMEHDMNLCTTSGLRRALVSIAAAMFGLSTAARAADLTVYTALEADQIKPYKAAFEKANPGINILWVRDSTGIITAKLLAEKANPKADVVM